MRRQRGRVGLMAAALVGLMVGGGAQAQVTTERSASILVWPKVISDGTRDTIIQITNTSNSMVHAHCFYVNGASTDPTLPPDPDSNPPRWVEIDFDIMLTKQQPTHWVVSTGRLFDPEAEACSETEDFFACNDAGLNIGRVPPVDEFFTGELKCIEVDMSGAPVSGNRLKGEATTVALNVCNAEFGECQLSGEECEDNSDCLDTFDVAKYNALGIIGNENNNGDNVLCLGGEPSDECEQGAEYDACPQFWIANHFAEGAPYPVATDPDAATVDTAWTIVPCTQNFETQVPESVTIFIQVWNEFEQPLSVFANITCWAELFLDDSQFGTTFDFFTLGSAFAQSRLRSANQTASGFLMVGSEFHAATDGPPTWVSLADVNYHVEGARSGPDIITIPAEQIGGGAGPTP
jgi:hypothetical protein